MRTRGTSTRGMRIRGLSTRGLAGLVLVATLPVAGCANRPVGSASPSAAASTTAASPMPAVGAKIDVGGHNANYHGTADVSGAEKVTVQLGDRFFDPTVIRGKPGQKLTLALENKSNSSHTFTTADGLADIEVKPMSFAEGKITLPQSGNLLFFCKVDKDLGMVGVFKVSGPVNSPVPTASPLAT